jgi:hypothetical protein
MAAAKPASSDFGAAVSGLVLGGSVLFLVMLAIVWLTNRHFEGLKASGAHGAPAAAHSTPPGNESNPSAPSTTGTGTQAPAAPSAAPTGH